MKKLGLMLLLAVAMVFVSCKEEGKDATSMIPADATYVAAIDGESIIGKAGIKIEGGEVVFPDSYKSLVEKGMSGNDKQELADKGDTEDLAFGDPPEIQRDKIERNDIDHRLMVEYDHITPLPIDMLQPFDPARKGKQETLGQPTRKFMHDAPRLLKRIGHRQRHDGDDEHDGTVERQPDVIEDTQHKSIQSVIGTSPVLCGIRAQALSAASRRREPTIF